MSHSDASPRNLRRQQVYDPVLRLLHAWNGLAVLVLLFSGLSMPWIEPGSGQIILQRIHAVTGYALLLGVYARLVWGMIGPGHARWSGFWQPAAWRAAWQQRRLFDPPSGTGHPPMASLVFLAVYLAMLGMLATGVALLAIEQNSGPLYPWLGHAVVYKGWLSPMHTLLAYLLGVFVLVHVAALVLHKRLHGLPVAQAMVNGYQYVNEVAT
jgi:cytochrome b